MAGQPESISWTENGAVVAVARGDKGVALANISSRTEKINIATTLPDGTYTDAVHACVFKVNKGKLTGKLAPYSSAIITR